MDWLIRIQQESCISSLWTGSLSSIIPILINAIQASHFCLNRSLARDNKHAVEREQVIKLIRTIVDIVSEPGDRRSINGTGMIPLSEPIMRAFLAVAEHAEDPFRPICVQTLAEMGT